MNAVIRVDVLEVVDTKKSLLLRALAGPAPSFPSNSIAAFLFEASCARENPTQKVNTNGVTYIFYVKLKHNGQCYL